MLHNTKQKIGTAFILTTLLFSVAQKSVGQVRPDVKTQQSAEDSLLNEFRNTIYNTFYNPAYMQVTTPTFTMLKVDINWEGKVTNIAFSDSADPVFVNAWANRKSRDNDKATLEKFVQIKKYRNVALLIPVSYQPNYDGKTKSNIVR